MRLSKHREMKHTKIEIIPMIDTMFFLLIFFILQSLDILNLRGFNLDLPDAAAGPRVSQKDLKEVKLEVAVAKDGTMMLNGDSTHTIPFERSAREDMLNVVNQQLRLKSGDPNYKATSKELEEITMVVIPDAESNHEHVIHAVDNARAANIKKFSLR